MIFVHCSSVAQYVEDVRGVPKILDFGDMDSQKWLEYARYKPFPLSLGYWLEGEKMEREKNALPASSISARQQLAPNGKRWSHTAPRGAATGFPTAWMHVYFAPDETSYDADTICFVGRMDYYPNQECMFDFCANVLPRIQRSARRRSC